MAEETTETERVSMQWPKELKAQVRDKVGARGLTEFVLEAVAVHLAGGAEREQMQAQEINELKWLVQQLADRVAIGGDSENRKSGLMELELPSWISTSGWPSEMAELVRPESWVPEEAISQVECPQHKSSWHNPDSECPKCRLERRAQEADAKDGPAPVAPGDGVAPGEELKVIATPKLTKSGSGDHLARVMEMARKKGVDLADISLKPASEIERPEPKPITDAEAEEAIEVMEEVVQIATADDEDPNAIEVEQLRAEAASAAGLCSRCGSELVDGECWTCD